MKRILFILLLFPILLQAQDTCVVCNTVNLNGSSYQSGLQYQWTCTDGQTSSLQSPTLTVTQDMSCTIVVTDPSTGCVGQSTLYVDNCECSVNNPCASASYNGSTDCVDITLTGANVSTVATDSVFWKNQNTAFDYTTASTLCGCDIKEYLGTTPTVNVNVGFGEFELGASGLTNICGTNTSTNPRAIYTFPNTGFNGLEYPNGNNVVWKSITPADLVSAGNVMNGYMRYDTPFGTVINHYRYTYNGNGLAVGNISVQIVDQRVIYKDITLKRKVTYTDLCPIENCEVTLDIPQQPNTPCANFFTYINTVNFSAPCSGSGLQATAFNPIGSLTYQWRYNGTNIVGETTNGLCMVSRPFGTYSVLISDGTCSDEPTIISQAACNLGVNITNASGVLTANLTNCATSVTYQWQQWNGTSWINVGTASTYNTNNIQGDYRVNVVCGTCSAIGNFTFTPPCTISMNIVTNSTQLQAFVNNCGGSSIAYLWEIWNGSTWVTVQSISTTATNNSYSPTASGLYRITVGCNGCTDQQTTTFNIANPCTNFLVNINGSSTTCTGGNTNYGVTISGGSGGYTYNWKLNGTTVSTNSTYNYSPISTSSSVLSVTVIGSNSCSYTASLSISAIICCTLSAGSLSSQSVCTNQNATFTASPTGGTPPYNYNWTANGINQGGGNSITIQFATAGTYPITVAVTDANGCASNASTTLTTTTCTTCACGVNLALVGCQLQGTFTGAGCANYTYQLQYSATGSGWSSVQSGSATNFIYNPTQNGFYRVVATSSSCSGLLSPQVQVTCYNPTCATPPTITVNAPTGCETGAILISCSFTNSTQVTVSTTGTGTLSNTTFTSSPFNVTFTPSFYQANVNFTFTTNNPNGSPCVAASQNVTVPFATIATPTITSSNTDICNGTSRLLVGSPTGGTFTVTGAGVMSGNTLNANSVGAINVTYTYGTALCQKTATQTINSIACPCNGLALPVTISTGRVSFGAMTNNGVAISNYRIEWRKVSDNSIVFISGMGTGGGSGIYAHPFSNIPLLAGSYYPFILTSDVGNNLNCFSQFTILPWTCVEPPTYTYNGPGGTAATGEFDMTINSTITSIKIGNYGVQTVPDLLEVIYNGATIYSTSTIQFQRIIPITYVSGINTVRFKITNSNPTVNTIWSISNIKCCDDPSGGCPSSSPTLTSAPVTNNGCGCTFASNPTYTNDCNNCSENFEFKSFSNCSSTSKSLILSCQDDAISITKPNNFSRQLTFTNATVYNSIKSTIQNNIGNYILRIDLRSVQCASDGQLAALRFYSNNATYVYDDILLKITITILTNSFVNNCVGCNEVNYNNYQGILSQFSGSTFVGTYQSILVRKEVTSAVIHNQNNSLNKDLTCTSPCTVTIPKRYNIYIRDINCPCQSWQFFYDADNNGTYETLIDANNSWTGTCN